MAYATRADVQAAYDQVMLDRLCMSGEDNLPKLSMIDTGLDDASAEIDSYVSTKYAVPVTPTPRILKRMCMDMAIYHIAFTHDRLTESMCERYKSWCKHLDGIGKGLIGLGVREDQSDVDPVPAVGSQSMSGYSLPSVRG